MNLHNLLKAALLCFIASRAFADQKTGTGTNTNTRWSEYGAQAIYDGSLVVTGQLTVSTINATSTNISISTIVISGLNKGSVLFANSSGMVGQNNSKFYWDDAKQCLGINIIPTTTTLSLQLLGPIQLGAISGYPAGANNEGLWFSTTSTPSSSFLGDISMTSAIGNGTQAELSINCYNFQGATRCGIDQVANAPFYAANYPNFALEFTQYGYNDGLGNYSRNNTGFEGSAGYTSGDIECGGTKGCENSVANVIQSHTNGKNRTGMYMEGDLEPWRSPFGWLIIGDKAQTNIETITDTTPIHMELKSPDWPAGNGAGFEKSSHCFDLVFGSSDTAQHRTYWEQCIQGTSNAGASNWIFGHGITTASAGVWGAGGGNADNGPIISTAVTISDGNVMTLAKPLPVGSGGTGQTTYTDGQLLIGDSLTGGLDTGTIRGTANQISPTVGHGTLSLALSQDIAAISSPTFSSMTLTGAALGIKSGGTNSQAALANGFAIISKTGAIVEGATTVNSCGYIIGTVVQSSQTSNTGATTSSGTGYTATPSSATITPKCSSDVIEISITGNITNTTTGSSNAFASIFRGVSDLSNGNGFCQLTDGTALTNMGVPCSMTYLDSPATTSATTYDVKIKSSAAGDAIWNIVTGSSVILLKEIAN